MRHEYFEREAAGKWSQASRQNTLAAGLKEWGMLSRTIHAARYLFDQPFRRAVSRQLNKGESLQIAVPALVGDLTNTDAGQTVERVQARAFPSPPAGDDLTYRAPPDPH